MRDCDLVCRWSWRGERGGKKEDEETEEERRKMETRVRLHCGVAVAC